MLRYALFVLALGCGDNLKTAPDASSTPDAPSSNALRHCLDSPETIVLAPSNQLPCDLLPPGFGQ